MHLSEEEKDVDTSTVDLIKIHELHNTRFWTVMCYLGTWFVILLKLAILGADTYTCISILVFHRWSSDDYQVYEFHVAKWLFTGCIVFRFLLLAWQIAWAIHIYRTKNIALAYLNNYASLMYSVRSYDYHCLFHAIERVGFFEWAAFFIYFNLDDALEVLVADLPHQVINILTLRYYATGGDLNNDVLLNIKTIATTNIRLAVILSVQLLSVAIFAFFFFQFVLAMIFFIPIKVKLSDKGFRLFKSFCYLRVNEKVRFLVSRNHKSRAQILDEGILDAAEIRANPLLSSSSTFDLENQPFDRYNPFGESAVLLDNLMDRRPPRAYTASSLRGPFTRLGSASSLTKMPLEETTLEENPFEGPFDRTTTLEGNTFGGSYDRKGAFDGEKIYDRKGTFDSSFERKGTFDSSFKRTEPFDSLLDRKETFNSSLDRKETFGRPIGRAKIDRKETLDFASPFLDARSQSLDHFSVERTFEHYPAPFSDTREEKDEKEDVSVRATDLGHTEAISLQSEPATGLGSTPEKEAELLDDVTSPLLDQDPANDHKAPYPERGVSRYFED